MNKLIWFRFMIASNITLVYFDYIFCRVLILFHSIVKGFTLNPRLQHILVGKKYAIYVLWHIHKIIFAVMTKIIKLVLMNHFSSFEVNYGNVGSSLMSMEVHKVLGSAPSVTSWGPLLWLFPPHEQTLFSFPHPFPNS